MDTDEMRLNLSNKNRTNDELFCDDFMENVLFPGNAPGMIAPYAWFMTHAFSPVSVSALTI